MRAFVIAVGASYGVILAALSFAAAGFGHGTYIPAAVSSAPLGALGLIGRLGASPALCGAPFVWGLVGALLERAGTSGQRWLVIVMGIHYLSAGMFCLDSDWEAGDPWLRGLWLAAYLTGQVALWWRFRYVVGGTQ